MPDQSEPCAPLLDEQLCFALYSTSRAITKVYADLLADIGLTYPQYAAMLILWEKDGIGLKTIADRLELERATTTPLVQRLEKLGLARKTRSKTDERHLEVFLTDEGRAMRAQVLDMPHRLGCALNISDADAMSLLARIKALRASIG